MNDKQREALKDLSERYGVPFKEEFFLVHAEDSWTLPSYAEGWIGGQDHQKLYVGCDPEGRISS